MKKILLTTAILAIFTNYIDNASAADRLAALRAQLLAQQQKQPVTTAPKPAASALPAPHISAQPRTSAASEAAKQSSIKDLELKIKEQESDIQKLKQENDRLSKEIGILRDQTDWAISTIDHIVYYCFGGYSEETLEKNRRLIYF